MKLKKNTLSGKVEKTSSSKAKIYTVDLNLRTPVQYGYRAGSIQETANAMVRLSVSKGLDVIAITDTFSCAFIDPLLEAKNENKLVILPGVDIRVEVCGVSDVSFVALFDPESGSSKVRSLLESFKNKSKKELNLSFLIDETEKLGGTLYPSKIDKTPRQRLLIDTLISEYGFRTFDLAYLESEILFYSNWTKEDLNLYSFSNATSLAQVGSRYSKIKLGALNFKELAKTFKRGKVKPLAKRVEKEKVRSARAV